MASRVTGAGENILWAGKRCDGLLNNLYSFPYRTNHNSTSLQQFTHTLHPLPFCIIASENACLLKEHFLRGFCIRLHVILSRGKYENGQAIAGSGDGCLQKREIAGADRGGADHEQGSMLETGVELLQGCG